MIRKDDEPIRLNMEVRVRDLREVEYYRCMLCGAGIAADQRNLHRSYHDCVIDFDKYGIDACFSETPDYSLEHRI